MDVSLEEKVRALQSPAAYEPPVGSVQAIETHFAWVFLTDGLAYKLKKPVVNPPLDQGSLQARLRSCREELRLNRRLAAEVYLDVVPLKRDSDGELRVQGRGTAVEWLVKMRRLPEALMLDNAMLAGRVSRDSISAVAALLAEFYRHQPPVELAPAAYFDRLLEQIRTNERELLAPDLAIAPALVETLAAEQHAAAQTLQPQVSARAQRKRIIEAHGDLRPEHIYLGSPPCVIDSLEFSRELRTLDPCEEIAYLAVECERAGFGWIGRSVLETYRARVGDEISSALFDLYRSHRAATRAKVVAWHVRDPQYRGREPWTDRATTYLRYAHACLSSP